MIPFVDLQKQYDHIGRALEGAVIRTLRSARYVKGGEVTSFEAQWSDYIGPGTHTACVSSGTSALELAMRAHGIGQGCSVAVPAMSFFATAEAVVNVGASPVFVDVDEHGNMDAAQLNERARQVDAIIPVHLYGRPAKMSAIEAFARPRGIPIIEDAAQAHGGSYRTGQPVGSRGNTCAWSFYPGKNLGSICDAGAVTTPDRDLADEVRALRDHGRRWGKYEHDVVGTNARMSEIAATALRLKLPFLSSWRAKRLRAARRYKRLMTQTPGTTVRGSVTFPSMHRGHAWHLFVVRIKRVSRDAVKAGMMERGVRVGLHYPVALPDQPALAQNAGQETMIDAFPMARALADECLSLPLFPEITVGQQARVALALKGALREASE